MTDTQITQALLPRSPLPSVYAVITEFRISYQRARRCLVAAGWVEAEPGEHDLIKTGDADSFSAIEDGNGEVVLAYCRICQKGEVDLGAKCFGRQKPVKKEYCMEDF